MLCGHGGQYAGQPCSATQARYQRESDSIYILDGYHRSLFTRTVSEHLHAFVRQIAFYSAVINTYRHLPSTTLHHDVHSFHYRQASLLTTQVGRHGVPEGYHNGR